MKAIRKKTGLTQEAFAMRYGFNIGRLRDLEQKRTHPDSVVRAYLLVIRKNPKAVNDALRARGLKYFSRGVADLRAVRGAKRPNPLICSCYVLNVAPS